MNAVCPMNAAPANPPPAPAVPEPTADVATEVAALEALLARLPADQAPAPGFETRLAAAVGRQLRPPHPPRAQQAIQVWRWSLAGVLALLLLCRAVDFNPFALAAQVADSPRLVAACEALAQTLVSEPDYRRLPPVPVNHAAALAAFHKLITLLVETVAWGLLLLLGARLACQYWRRRSPAARGPASPPVAARAAPA